MKTEEVANALSEAFDADLVEVTRHFWDELRADAFVLADVRYAVGTISQVVELGPDRAVRRQGAACFSLRERPRGLKPAAP